MQQFVGAPRLNTKERKQPNRYKSLVEKVIGREPSTYDEVAQHQVWQDAMVEEYNSMTNNVWEIVPRPMDRSVVSSRWIYKIN